jgi:hypothetical protein
MLPVNDRVSGDEFMDKERASLRYRLEQLADDELLRRYRSGDMTALASEVAADELRARGLSTHFKADHVEETETNPSRFSMQGDVICLARLTSPVEADILCGLLDAEGIRAVAADANLVRVNSLLAQALGGIRIMVHESDLLRARDILQALHRGDFALSGDDRS